MSKIPGIPVPRSKPRKKMKRVTTSERWIQQGPLVPWMLHYLQWLANEPTAALSKPLQQGQSGRSGFSVSQKTRQAGLLAKRTMYPRLIRMLEQREDAIAYFDKLRADLSFRAREMLSPDVETNIIARRVGLEMAKASEDHKAIEHYTRPFVELAFPKKVESEGVKSVIVLQIGQSAQHLISRALEEEDDIQDVEVEILETKRLNPGEDDG